MRALSFTIEPFSMNGSSDAAYINEGESLSDELVLEVVRNLRTDIEITIGDVTNHLAAWQDPEHWASDWAEQLGVDHDDAPSAVQAIMEGALGDL